MKFSLFSISRDEYRGRILRQLADDKCLIFFDTNLFSQLFKLYSGARKEFYLWFNSDAINCRVKIANWSMQEYNSRAVNGKLTDYLDGVQALKTLEKNFSHTGNFLQMFYDAEIRGSSYGSKEEFMNDLQLVKEKFRKIAGSVKIEKNTVEIIHEEFREQLSNAVIDSNVFNITSNIQQEAEFRYQNNIPPGYKDDNKQVNKYGDLIIWKEILQYCVAHEVESLIFVSNDGKRDLVYHPLVPTRNGARIKMDDVTLPDPRLVDEFRTHTKSDELSIINFATLISLLQEIDRTAFVEISSAIQIAMSTEASHNGNEVPVGSYISQSEAVATDTFEEELKAESGIKSKQEAVENIPEQPTGEREEEVAAEAIGKERKLLPYSNEALYDKEFSDNEHGPLLGVATSLGFQSWHIQNDAISKLKNAENTVITNKDLLFVIGRRIYSAACGSAFEAVNYIQTFEFLSQSRDSFQNEHILNGMLYEIYFSSTNEFRKNKFKAGFIDLLFSIIKNPRFKNSKGFIYKALDPVRHHLFALPGEEKTVNVRLQLTPGEVFPKAAEFIIEDIEIEGRSIVLKKDPDDDPFYESFGFNTDFQKVTESKFLQKLSDDIGVPAGQLKIIEPLNLEEDKFAVYTMAQDKTISIP